MRTKDLFNFIKERQNIYLAREAGKPKPWTKNPFLQRYRFCNVYREQDRVTQWIAENWRTPHKNDRELWFAMAVARFVNLPDSLDAVGWPVPWREQYFIDTLHRRQQQKQTVFNAAYIVSTNGMSMDKIEYVARMVLSPLWAGRGRVNEVIHPKPVPALAQVHCCLTRFEGLGSFMGAQVIADLKYVQPLRKARDWQTWAASGPGSRRGLNRMLGYAPDQNWIESRWLAALQELQSKINPKMKKAGMEPLHAQDLQNCLCEFDKMERARLGEGRPKQRYAGAA
jgi:hypothetical protein